MTQIKFKNLPAFNKQIEKKIKKAVSDPKLLEEIGDVALTHVKGRMRLGQLPDQKGFHKAPSSAWIKKRKELVKSGKVKTWNGKRPGNKSPIFTGQLADSLAFKINRAKRKVTIIAKGNHKPYTKGGKQIANSKLLDYIREKREVFGFTETKKKEILEIAKRYIRRALK